MAQNYKIHYNERFIWLVDKQNHEVDSKMELCETGRIPAIDFQKLMQDFLDDAIGKNVVLSCENTEHCKNELSKNLVKISAAGGLVQNEKRQFLLIFRMGKWDLPKGKLEEQEQLQNCAKREVEEETGIEVLSVDCSLVQTHHIYFRKNQFVFKETHWFLMKGKPEAKLQPQLEEEIEKVIWANENEIDHLLKNTYPSIIEVFEAFYNFEK